MQELDVTNVRELEDFLINECMYSVCVLVTQYFIYKPMKLTSLVYLGFY